jgi:hypothetical protein
MSDGLMHAPFTLSQRVALIEWQECPWAHPLTCGNCSCALPMTVETRGLVCIECFHVQPHAPELCMDLPPDPATLLNLQRFEVTFSDRGVPSTFRCTAAGPAQALTMLLADIPDAPLPFTVSEAA